MLGDLTECNVDEADEFCLGFGAATNARYWMTFLVFSVLPAPDSPVHKILWSSLSCSMCLARKQLGLS